MPCAIKEYDLYPLKAHETIQENYRQQETLQETVNRPLTAISSGLP
jgi:hypothetical protein